MSSERTAKDVERGGAYWILKVHGRYVPGVTETASKLYAVINNTNDPSIATRFARRRGSNVGLKGRRRRGFDSSRRR